jgi:hypothetical protein
LAVSIDLRGFADYYEELYLSLGMEMTETTERFYKQHDKYREKKKVYEKSKEVRQKKSTKKLDHITVEWKREIIDKKKGNTYRSRMMNPQSMAATTDKVVAEGAEGVKGKNGVVKKIVFCKKCGNSGHQRASSRLCPMNPKNVQAGYCDGTFVTCVLVSKWVLCPM